MENQLVITSPDGAFRAYIARPASQPAPAVIVLQELFGVNADIRATCDALATQGFIAIAPDLFWRQEPGVDLDVTTEASWQHGLALYTAFNRDAGVKDIMETVRTAVELPESTGRIALLGYCLGALMAFITAARYEVDAAVAYHGADRKIPRRAWRNASPVADAPRRRGRVHLKASSGRDQSGLGTKTERDRLQLSGSASRVFSTQRAPLRRRGGGAS